jgi:tRNA (guanine-N1)-methyltransferase
MTGLGDMERLIGRIVYGTAGGRDMASLRAAIEKLPAIRAQLEQFSDRRLLELTAELDTLDDIGGEIAAAAMVDSTVRLLPGVLGGGAAATSSESFSSSGLLEAPQYTHPAEFRGMKVPEVLLSGDHRRIEAWREAQSRIVTATVRPELLK